MQATNSNDNNKQGRANEKEQQERLARSLARSLTPSRTGCCSWSSSSEDSSTAQARLCVQTIRNLSKNAFKLYLIIFNEFALNAQILQYNRLHKNAVNNRRNLCDGASLSLRCCFCYCRCFTAAALLSLLLFLLLLQFDFGLQLLFGFRLLQLISFAKNQISLSHKYRHTHTHIQHSTHTHRDLKSRSFVAETCWICT